MIIDGDHEQGWLGAMAQVLGFMYLYAYTDMVKRNT